MAEAHRREWGFVLAATVRRTRDLDLAEECVQEAYAQALARWPVDGVPDRPAAWLTTVARRRAVDQQRRDATLRGFLPLLVEDKAVDEQSLVDQDAGAEFADDRLRLIFTCCHPALALESQVALTLRLLCGLTTREVARAFLVGETTMGARLTRAKRKISAARIPYRVPSTEQLPARIEAVLSVVHLLFTTGHAAPEGSDLVRSDLTARALDLARLLHVLLPDDADVAGLLALILVTDARRATRTTSDGRLLPLAEQDRSRWDGGAINEGVALVRQAISGGHPGRYALQAAIAAVHAEAPTYGETDWSEIVGLYDVLLRIWPSPVVALNRAVALGMASGPADGLAALDQLNGEPLLARYGYFPAARAHFLFELGRGAQAAAAYEQAIDLTENAVQRAFLIRRRQEVLDTPTARKSFFSIDE